MVVQHRNYKLEQLLGMVCPRINLLFNAELFLCWPLCDLLPDSIKLPLGNSSDKDIHTLHLSEQERRTNITGSDFNVNLYNDYIKKSLSLCEEISNHQLDQSHKDGRNLLPSVCEQVTSALRVGCQRMKDIHEQFGVTCVSKPLPKRPYCLLTVTLGCGAYLYMCNLFPLLGVVTHNSQELLLKLENARMPFLSDKPWYAQGFLTSRW